LPKADAERQLCAELFVKMHAKCPEEHKELQMRFAAMLMPDMVHYQNLWAKELAKLPEDKAQDSIDNIDECLKHLSVAKIKSEHQSSLYRDFIGKNHVNEKIKEFKKADLASADFGNNMTSIIRSQTLHEFLDKTLKDADAFRNTDAREHNRRGTLKKMELDKANGFPAVDKANAYVKVALLTQNMICLTRAVAITENLTEVAEKSLVIETIKHMREIAAAKPSYTNKFIITSAQSLQKLEK
jgi:hypothetical protein